METQRWGMILVTIILIVLIYNFLSTIFRSDVKRFSHDRIYVDYSTYKKRPDQPDKPGQTGTVYQQVELARRHIGEGRVEAAAQAYDAYMGAALAQMPAGAVPATNQRYDEMVKFARTPIDGLTQAKQLFARGQYQQAMSDFTTLLQGIPEADLYHRMEAFEGIAECFFLMKNKEGYVEYKVKYVRALQASQEIMRTAYPGKGDSGFTGWISSADATRQLLSLRSKAGDLGVRAEPLIQRAEFDLEVARTLNQ